MVNKSITQKQADILAFARAAELVKSMDFDDLFPTTTAFDENAKLIRAQARVVRILKEWAVYIEKVR